MVDIDVLFSDKAFDCLGDGLKSQLMTFCRNAQGKSLSEIIPIATTFMSAMPPASSLTTMQKQAIVKAVMEVADDKEKAKLMSILKVIGF